MNSRESRQRESRDARELEFDAIYTDSQWASYSVAKAASDPQSAGNERVLAIYDFDFEVWTAPGHEPEVVDRLTKSVAKSEPLRVTSDLQNAASNQTNYIRARDLGFFLILLSISIGAFSLGQPSVGSWLIASIVGMLSGAFLMLMDRAHVLYGQQHEYD